MEYLDYLHSLSKSPLTEALTSAYIVIFEAASQNGRRMPLPDEFRTTIENGFRKAIRDGRICLHATQHADRHSGMTSMQRSHDDALKVMDRIKEGDQEVPVVAGDYCIFPDRTVRYNAYTTPDWKNVVKLVSTNTEFPPAELPSFKVLTTFSVSDPKEATRWLGIMANSAGKEIDLGKPGVPREKGEKRTAYELARSKAKFIDNDIGMAINKLRKDTVNPLKNQLAQILRSPEDQQDANVIVDLCKRIREANLNIEDLENQRISNSKKIYTNTPRRMRDARMNTSMLCPDEEILPLFNEWNTIGCQRFQERQLRREAKLKLGELFKVPEGERDEARITELRKEIQDIDERICRLDEKNAVVSGKLLGMRGNS